MPRISTDAASHACKWAVENVLQPGAPREHAALVLANLLALVWHACQQYISLMLHVYMQVDHATGFIMKRFVPLLHGTESKAVQVRSLLCTFPVQAC